MIPSERIELICRVYDLGEFLSVRKIEEGVLNHNYLLETSKGRFFVKSIREKGRIKLPIISQVEHFMASQGIPAISAMETTAGEISITCADSTYTVYPFIESDRSHEYSLDDYKNMGKALAQIHLVTKIGVPEIFSHLITKRPSRQTILERFAKHKANICGKVQDDVDKLFLSYISLKEQTMSRLQEDQHIGENSLLHGDFHPGNLLFHADSREIIGVCDWEKVEVGPRGYEVARAILYSCFDGAEDVDQAIVRSKAFMAGYDSTYPISAEDFLAGFILRLERTALSSWIEETYYERNDDRANQFIANEMRTIELFFYQRPNLPALLKG